MKRINWKIIGFWDKILEESIIRKSKGNEMKSFILGAGASKSYTGSKTGVEPPLAKELFTTFSKLAISGDREVRIGEVVNYVRDTRNVQAWEFMNWNEDIESFLTEVESELKSLYNQYKFKMPYDLPPEIEVEFMFLQKVYDRMIFLFSSIMNEIQNGSLYPEYKSMVSTASHGDNFIIFNWDTLLDKVLFETGNWFLEDGYSVPFKAIFEDGWKPVDIQHKNKRSKYNLYKLHGSTNWLIPYYSFDFLKGKWGFSNSRADGIRRPVYLFHFANKRYKTYDDRSRVGYEPFSYFYYPPDVPIGMRPKIQDRQTISRGMFPDMKNFGITDPNKTAEASMPLIIPPVKHKNYEFLEGVIEDLWKKSKKALIQSDEIVIMGYSFPITDTKAWELLDEVVKKRRNDLPKITMVDPYPEGLNARIVGKYPQLEKAITVKKMTIKEYYGL